MRRANCTCVVQRKNLKKCLFLIASQMEKGKHLRNIELLKRIVTVKLHFMNQQYTCLHDKMIEELFIQYDKCIDKKNKIVSFFCQAFLLVICYGEVFYQHSQ